MSSADDFLNASILIVDDQEANVQPGAPSHQTLFSAGHAQPSPRFHPVKT
jgi:hypothetical protein